jgi:hypothetical protein
VVNFPVCNPAERTGQARPVLLQFRFIA